LNYTNRNPEISHKVLGTPLRTDNVGEREILANNLLFILISNNFPEHVWTYILYHSLCDLMQITFLIKFWTKLCGIERFRTKC